MGEIQTGGRLALTPISLTIGSFFTVYLLFSLSFKNIRENNSLARTIANFGMVPGIGLAMLVGWAMKAYPLPNIEMGITKPAFAEMWNYLPFTIGFPGIDLFLLAVPTAIIAYIIAFGDIIVGTTLVRKADDVRSDEDVDTSPDRVHIVTAIRNFIHALFAPYPGLAGPIWTAITATVAQRYSYGRKSMDSIYGGAGTFWIAGFIALFALPLVTLFQPVLPIGLSLTMIITGYLCISVGIEQATDSTQRGVAGVTAVVLAIHGAAAGLAVGVALFFLLEKQKLIKEPISEESNQTAK